MLVAGRDLGASLRAGARLASVNAIIVFTVTQVAMFNLLGMSDAASAEATYRAIDGQAAVIDLPPSATTAQISEVVEALPESVSPFVMQLHSIQTGESTSRESSVLSGAAADLEQVGVNVGTVTTYSLPDPLRTLIQASGAQEATFVAADRQDQSRPADEGLADEGLVSRSIVVIAAPDEGKVSELALRAVINQVVAPGWTVEAPGGGWRMGAWMTAHQSRWVAFTGIIGAIALLTAVWVRALDDNREATRRLGLLAAVTGSSRVFYSAAGWRIAVSTMLGVGLGGIIAWQYSGMITAMGSGMLPPYGLLTALMAVASSMAVAVWVISSFDSRRAMARWRPGQESQ